MPPSVTVSNLIFIFFFVGVVSFIFLISLIVRPPGSNSPLSKIPIHRISIDDSVLKGEAISGKLGNETLKAELGRAGWKLLHTTMAKFPDKPTEDEKTALFSYIHLFARLYPCGECARHFRQILVDSPPQVATRSSAAAWACHVHNEVNKSLKKELFDCSKIGDFYDCGCVEDDEKAKGDKINVQKEIMG